MKYLVIIFCLFLSTQCEENHHVGGRNLDEELDGTTTEVPQIVNYNNATNLTNEIEDQEGNETNVSDVTAETTTKFNVSLLLREDQSNVEQPIEVLGQPALNTPKGVDTEVSGLLNVPKEDILHQQPVENHDPAQIPDQVDDETELIDDGQNTEDEIRRHEELKSEAYDDESQPRYLAAVVACTLVVVAVLCYAALWGWRRYLEKRYGSRTMLVNAEEFDDPYDVHHFSI